MMSRETDMRTPREQFGRMTNLKGTGWQDGAEPQGSTHVGHAKLGSGKIFPGGIHEEGQSPLWTALARAHDSHFARVFGTTRRPIRPEAFVHKTV